MKPSRHQIAAGVTVVALGLLATVALASGGSDNPASQPQPAVQAAAATATPEVRTEIIRETVHRRAKRSGDSGPSSSSGPSPSSGPSATPAVAPVATPDDHGGRREDRGFEDEHGGRGRDHAEDDGTDEDEDHEFDDHGGDDDNSGRGRGGDDD